MSPYRDAEIAPIHRPLWRLPARWRRAWTTATSLAPARPAGATGADMAREMTITLGLFGMLPAGAFWGGVLLLMHCGHPPDPLVVSADALNVASGILAARVSAHEARVSAAAQAAAARCAPLADTAREACRSTAARQILDESARERGQLDALIMVHADARDALQLADRCRRDGASCEAAATATAIEALERLRAALAVAP